MADSSAYDGTHRAFLQAFLSRSTFTYLEAQPVLASILAAHDRRPTLPNDIREADLESYIHTLNAAMSAYDYEIRSSIPQSYKPTSNGDSGASSGSSRKRVYALVNTSSDPATQLATLHKPEEIAFVKRLLDEMFEHFNTPSREVMAVTSMQALAVARPRGTSNSANGRTSIAGATADGTQGPAAQGLSKTQAEALLQALVDEGWFVRVSGHYTLSPRALMELRDWLRETYNEPPDEDDEEGVERVKSCQACREIVTIGQRCRERRCKARLHEHCLAHFFRAQRGEKCPLCQAEWTGRDFVGPKAAGGRSSAGGVDIDGDARNGAGGDHDDE